MIKVKNLFDAMEEDDGQRLWVEPVGLTSDLREWCEVDHVLSHLGPSKRLAEWFGLHPDGYDYFRGVYHTELAASQFLPLLQQVAFASQQENFTLLHSATDHDHNSAAALHEYLSELQAYCPPGDSAD